MEYGTENDLRINMPCRFRSAYAKLLADVTPLKLGVRKIIFIY